MDAGYGYRISVTEDHHRVGSAVSINCTNNTADVTAIHKTLDEHSLRANQRHGTASSFDSTIFRTADGRFVHTPATATAFPLQNHCEYRIENLFRMNRQELLGNVGGFQGHWSLPLDMGSGFRVYPPARLPLHSLDSRHSSMSEPGFLSSFSALLSDGHRANDVRPDPVLSAFSGFHAIDVGGMGVGGGELTTYRVEGASDGLGFQRNTHGVNGFLAHGGINGFQYVSDFRTNYQQANGLNYFGASGFSTSDSSAASLRNFVKEDVDEFAEHMEPRLNGFHGFASISSALDAETVEQMQFDSVPTEQFSASENFQSHVTSEEQFVSSEASINSVLQDADAVRKTTAITTERLLPNATTLSRPNVLLTHEVSTASISPAAIDVRLKAPSSMKNIGRPIVKSDPENSDFADNQLVMVCSEASIVFECETGADFEPRNVRTRQREIVHLIADNSRNEDDSATVNEGDTIDMASGTVAVREAIEIMPSALLTNLALSLPTIVTEDNECTKERTLVINDQLPPDAVTRPADGITHSADAAERPGSVVTQSTEIIEQSADPMTRPAIAVIKSVDVVVRAETLNDEVTAIISAWLNQSTRKETPQGPVKEDRRRKVHQCKVCGKIVKKSKYLVVHMITHTGDKPYSCAVCDKRFAQQQHLKRHSRIHTGERPYQCCVCDKRFARDENLDRHMLSHTKVKDHACPVCSREFGTKGAVKTHLMVHTGERPFACTVCLRRFRQLENLNRHMTTHSGEKKFSCPTCNKQFASKQLVKIHQISHTTLRPHRCTICKKTYKASDSLRAHTRRKHLSKHAAALG